MKGGAGQSSAGSFVWASASRWADAPPVDSDLIEIAERVPHATLCLETALARHGLIDAIPVAIDIAIPRGSTRPALQAPSRNHTSS
ncbi:MAG: hypothetical protein ACYCO3_04760, partial [Mycobacteriales bacterium]